MKKRALIIYGDSTIGRALADGITKQKDIEIEFLRKRNRELARKYYRIKLADAQEAYGNKPSRRNLVMWLAERIEVIAAVFAVLNELRKQTKNAGLTARQ